MIRKTFVRTHQGVVARVQFRLPHSIWADRICLVGDFNGWDTTAHPMQRNSNGEWYIEIDLEPARRYEFRYLCDGERWMNDPEADAYEPNPYGGKNSVIFTDLPEEEGDWVTDGG
ncbi:MAG: isoamylase early set domain-containing protein [Anaerolineae bacterium]|nr:isoamylase early set domain-containing protein [Anaerolineae bacterium]MDW8069938.1 isoamylase early set domain-containing protein [Anaerolineae bacterium]